MRRERPLKRINPSGDVVWVARFTGRDGRRRSAGTFKLRGPCRQPARDGGCCAQHAIDAAYERDQAGPDAPETLGEYAATWTVRHPRSDRTNKTNDGRLRQVLDVELEGRKLRDWPMVGLRRRHATLLVDHMLRVQGRAAAGAQGILRVLSALTEDAITDECAEVNPWKGVKVRANDPRVRKAPRRIRVWSWGDMHAFARAAAAAESSDGMDGWRRVYAEAMVRVLADCGLRLGELLPRRRGDLRLGDGACRDVGCRAQGPHLHVVSTAYEGSVQAGTKTDHGVAEGGRVVPVPPGLAGLLQGLPARIDTPWLFPTVTGALWRERNFYRDVWYPAQKAAGLAPTPHEFRHSWISLLAAAGVDAADLADMAGHTVATMHGHYAHGLGRSFDAVRKAVGG